MKELPQLKRDWNETKDKLKLKFALLTDDDMRLTGGRQDELIGRLHLKLGKTKEELHKIISDL